MFAECDSKWQRRAIMREITERDNNSVEIASGDIMTKRGVRIARTMTKEWKLLCQWKDVSPD
jgi:hypothetical protein